MGGFMSSGKRDRAGARSPARRSARAAARAAPCRTLLHRARP
ncbi:hypothetical protein BMA721280_E0573 [Burkholderia mallei 2002721280]|nr:hypothetical protein BMA721280_E0573 [Burkholderia mallei 2002721280]EDP86092.1 hypothetical protein BMA10399_D0733 [Burkholderia mallei ATCC 10399]